MFRHHNEHKRKNVFNNIQEASFERVNKKKKCISQRNYRNELIERDGDCRELVSQGFFLTCLRQP